MASTLFTKLPPLTTKLSIAYVSPISLPYLLQFNLLVSITLFLTVTLFFALLYHILYCFLTWILDVRPETPYHDIEGGRSTTRFYGSHGVEGSSSTFSHHQAAFYQVLVQYNVQVVNTLERFMRDIDERRGQRLCAMAKLPQLASYGSSHGKEWSSCSECSICLEDFVEGESCQVLPVCNHIFHANCIGHWLRKKLTCPVCRNCILI